MSGIMSFVVRSSSRSLGLSPRVSRCCIIPTTTTSRQQQQQHCCSFSTCSPCCNCSCHLLSSKAAAASASVLSQHRFFASSSSSSSSSSAVAKKLTSDQKLSRVIESEIQCAQEEENDGLIQGNNLPDGFPFEIIDTPGEETITLKREFEGESIQVLVYMPQMDGEDDDQDNDNDDDTVSGQVNISMNVTVVKGDGPRLEFSCTASPDDIAIDSMLMKGPEDSSKEIPYEGPEFSDLDENLQNELHGYLERRGIKPSLTNFLQEYMVNKDSKEYLNWLKNMKEFVEK